MRFAVRLPCFVVWFATACSGATSTAPSRPPPAPQQSAAATIGTGGGVIDAGGGFELVIPALDVEQDTTIRIARTSDPAPAGHPGASTLFTVSPPLSFSIPVEVSLPVPEGITNPTIFWSYESDPTKYDDHGGVWDRAAKRISTGVMHFSGGFVAQSTIQAPTWLVNGAPVAPTQAGAMSLPAESCNGAAYAAELDIYLAMPTHPPVGGVCERVINNTPLAYRELLSLFISGGASLPGPGTYVIGPQAYAIVTHSENCVSSSATAVSGTITLATTSPEVTGRVDLVLPDSRTVSGPLSVPLCAAVRSRCSPPVLFCIQN